MLTAPDVDHGEFNNQFKHELKALAKNTTVYVSSNDRALLVSRIINRGLRLGESTLDPSNPGLEEQTGSFYELLLNSCSAKRKQSVSDSEIPILCRARRSSGRRSA